MYWSKLFLGEYTPESLIQALSAILYAQTRLQIEMVTDGLIQMRDAAGTVHQIERQLDPCTGSPFVIEQDYQTNSNNIGGFLADWLFALGYKVWGWQDTLGFVSPAKQSRAILLFEE